jgi:hypothetical protein
MPHLLRLLHGLLCCCLRLLEPPSHDLIDALHAVQLLVADQQF